MSFRKRIIVLFVIVTLILCSMIKMISSMDMVRLVLMLLLTILIMFVMYQILLIVLNKEFKTINNINDKIEKDLNIKNKENNEIIRLDNNINSLYQKEKDHLNNQKILNSYISHEVKNSISVISAKIQLEEPKEELLKSIHQTLNSIDNILALSEVKSRATSELCDLGLVCAMVVDDYQKKYPLLTYEQDDAVSEIYAKQHLIYSAISNLVDNAIKYGNNKEIVVKVFEKHHCVNVIVKDNGIGIEEKYVEQIFDPNFKLSKLKKNSYGIGLSLVKNVCDICNGSIYVLKRKDKGTAFVMSFPVADV